MRKSMARLVAGGIVLTIANPVMAIAANVAHPPLDSGSAILPAPASAAHDLSLVPYAVQLSSRIQLAQSQPPEGVQQQGQPGASQQTPAGGEGSAGGTTGGAGASAGGAGAGAAAGVGAGGLNFFGLGLIGAGLTGGAVAAVSGGNGSAASP